MLPQKNSFFLFGPRQTGKSTLIKGALNKRESKDYWEINLLLSDQFSKYSKYPSLFRKEALQKIQHEGIKIIFIDEIQKVPILLNEVQAILDEMVCQFILTGSSARKLKRGGANLLGGRGLQRFLFPFIFQEIENSFNLDEVLRFGSLPSIYDKSKSEKIDLLNAYTNAYLREEIQAEGIVRNLGGFARFLDIAASQFGELVSFTNIGRECQLPTKTVQSYYQILEDTLIGVKLESWRKSLRKRLTAHPKFYLFDLGVTNCINRHLSEPPDPILRGRLFEQFIVLETKFLLHYRQSEANLFYWRTNTGSEVDLLIEKHGKITAAFKIKAKKLIGGFDFSGLKSFQTDYSKTPCFIICEADEPYQENDIMILPWEKYLNQLGEFL